MSAERLFLVSYDIADRRRWRRAHKLVKEHGERQQLSVFLCRLTPERMQRLASRLGGILDPAADRLMVADLGLAMSARLPVMANQPSLGGPARSVVL